MGKITANSTPVYSAMPAALDLTYFFTKDKQINTDRYLGVPAWTSQDWMDWWKAKQLQNGSDQANKDWGNAWLDGLSSSAGGRGLTSAGSGVAYDSVPEGDRTTNDNFRKFLKDNNYLYNIVYSGLGGEIGKAIGGTKDIAENIGSVATNVSKGINYGAIAAKYAIPVLIGLGAIGMIWYGIKKIQNA